METITDEQIKNLNISSSEMLDWINVALLNKQDCRLPEKISIKLDNHVFHNYMPCVIPKLNIAGEKIVTRYPNRTPSLESKIFLFDYETGGQKMNCLLDGNFITTMRTACVAVHSLKLLAKSNYKTISILGLGEIGNAFIKVLIETATKPLNIQLLRYKNQAEQTIEKFKSCKNINFTIVDDYQTMAKNSDVIVSAVTYLENDLADPSIYKKGVLIIPIHTRGFMECDLAFDKIFCDDISHVQGFKYFNQYKYCHEVAEIVGGNGFKGRESDDERIIVYNIGIALHDLYFANKIYEKIKK